MSDRSLPKTLALIAIACALLLLAGLLLISYLRDNSIPSPNGIVTLHIKANPIPGGNDRIESVRGKAVSVQFLRAELSRIKRNIPEVEVFVAIEGQASPETLMDVIGEVKRAGIGHVGVYTTSSPPPKGHAPIS